jgi:DNA polymerase-3 subunit gamma/tau
MPRVLSLSLRPHTLSGLFGQEALVKSIRHHQATRPPQAWLFTGATGTGKTTISRILSVAYQCPHQKLWGDPCDTCWAEREGFAIHEINASDVSGVEELGRVAQLSRTRPVGSAKRVIILDEFQRASNAAQNLMLKPMEEPPATTVWIVCTTDPAKILATLRRRLTTYQIKGFTFSQREAFLTRVAATIKLARPLAPLFEQVHLADVSGPALLLQALEKYAAGGSPEEAVAGSDAVSTDSLRICKAMTAGDWPSLCKLLQNVSADEARWVRSSTSGWVKGVLARSSGKESARAATSLQELTAPAPLEDNLLVNWLWATLYRICQRYTRNDG